VLGGVGSMYQPNLRPLGFGEILDGAFVLYRRNFAAFLAMSALPLAPVLACQLLLVAGGVKATAAWMLIAAVGVLPGLLATGALICATADAYDGLPVDVRRAFATARARYWTQLRAVVVAGLVTLLGFIAFIVPGIIASVRYFAVSQTAVLEDTTPSEARHRSSHLSRGAGWRILGMMAVLTVIARLPVLAQLVFGEWLGRGYADSGLRHVAEQLILILTLPLTTAALTLLYFDRRVRVDAMDVQVAMQRIALEG
jgi:hypothetical protein